MNTKSNYPHTKEILYLLGIGVLLSATVIAPGVGVLAQNLYNEKKREDWKQTQKEWKKFNLSLLKRNLKRLQQQKKIEVVEEDGYEIIKLTQKGQVQYLRFKLENLVLEEKPWDKKWRLVIYDVSKLKRNAQESFRHILKRIKFYQLQKSVYITPYECRKEISYLREFFNLGEEVLILEVSNIENEAYYREYFGV